MPGYLRHITACNQHKLTSYRPFVLAKKQVGYIQKPLADMLLFDTNHFSAMGHDLHLSNKFEDFDARTKVLAEIASMVAARRTPPAKLRDELYPVKMAFTDEPLAVLDRAAVPWFGVRGWGVHVNGFVRRPDGLHIWIGERALDRGIAPGQYDNLIAGGQPYGLTLEENLQKEAAEEAGMEATLAATARPAGSISYTYELKEGIRQDTLFVYDLEVPESFVPVNKDGEVARFHLLPIAEIAELVRTTDKFKFNVNLVIIDFLLRHSVITQAESEYAALMDGLKKAA